VVVGRTTILILQITLLSGLLWGAERKPKSPTLSYGDYIDTINFKMAEGCQPCLESRNRKIFSGLARFRLHTSTGEWHSEGHPCRYLTALRSVPTQLGSVAKDFENSLCMDPMKSAGGEVPKTRNEILCLDRSLQRRRTSGSLRGRRRSPDSRRSRVQYHQPLDGALDQPPPRFPIGARPELLCYRVAYETEFSWQSKFVSEHPEPTGRSSGKHYHYGVWNGLSEAPSIG